MNPDPPQDPRRQAVALRYDARDGAAPRVVASGRGEVADRIRAVAAEHAVPLVEDPDLVALLAACDLGAEVPEELFEVVATLLALLFELNDEARARAGFTDGPARGTLPR